MPLSSTTEICMLVWPASAATQVLGPDDSIAWVVGWNDRSLYIIVAWFLRNCTLPEAKVELHRIQAVLKNYHGNLIEMPYRNLTILGCVRPNSAPSSFNLGYAAEEDDIRQARKDSYLWLELLEGPVLAELWCCGARVQPCQLHVVRCDPSKVLSIRPSIFTATALYGVSGVRQLQSGAAPVCAPGAGSNLEGVLLPPVMRKEAEPRALKRPQQRRCNPAVVNDSIALAADDSFFYSDRDTAERIAPMTDRHRSAVANANHSPTALASSSFNRDAELNSASLSTATVGRDGSRGAGGGASAAREHLTQATIPDESVSLSEGDGSVTLVLAGALVLSDSEVEHADSYDRRARQLSPSHTSKDMQPQRPAPLSQGATAPPPPQHGVPPRLDFTSTTDRAEMSVFLATMRAGRNVRRVIQNEPPHHYIKEDPPEPLTGLTKFTVDCLTRYVVGTLKLLRFSKTAELLLYRSAEFAHFLCAVSSASVSCGLHPVLPHQVSSSVNQRYVCIFGYISRCAVDLILGVLVYLCVSAWGPSLYVASQYMTRHWLYEVHAAYMDWFDGYPAGLKVNEDLNMALCFFAKCVLELWDSLLTWSPATLPSLGSIHLEGANSTALLPTATAAPSMSWAYPTSEDQLRAVYEWVGMAFHLRVFCLLGCSTAAAFVSDLTGLVSLHLRFLYHAIALPYRFALHLLRNLFRQFYGVKYNPLRRRYDGYHFETDQMLAATFLFVIISFLFPTLLVYYVYFAIVLGSIWAMESCLECIAYLSLNVPIHPIVYWLLERHRLTGGVALSNPVITSVRRFLGRGSRPGSEEEELASHTVEVTVEALPLPLAMMLTDFFVVVDILMARLQPAKVVSLMLRGRVEWSPKMTDVIGPHLLTSCVSPRCTLCVPPAEKAASPKK